MTRAGRLAVSALLLATLVVAAPLAARAGDGGTPPTLHVAVTTVTFSGKADPAARSALPGSQVAAALCDGLQTRKGVACLTPSDFANLSHLRALQAMAGACNGGGCAQEDGNRQSVDDRVQATVEVKGSGYVLHLVVIHPPSADPVYRADVPASSAMALLKAAKAAAVKAAGHLVGP